MPSPAERRLDAHLARIINQIRELRQLDMADEEAREKALEESLGKASVPEPGASAPKVVVQYDDSREREYDADTVAWVESRLIEELLRIAPRKLHVRNARRAAELAQARTGLLPPTLPCSTRCTCKTATALPSFLDVPSARAGQVRPAHRPSPFP